jgi:hypothetical protein
MDIKRAACQYAIMRFMPMAETEEFANIGVVLISPEARYFGFRLIKNRTGRVNQFFSEVDSSLLRESVRDFRSELARARDVLMRHGFDKRLKDNDEPFARAFFHEITRPREAIVRFSDPRVLLANNPGEALDALYQRYIERSFVGKSPLEYRLESKLKKLFKAEGILRHYSARKIGDEIYSVNFPLVDMYGGKPQRVIKPLNITDGDPSKIIERGGLWAVKIRELQRRNTLPKNVLFAVDDEKDLGGRVREAYEEAKRLLMEQDVELLEASRKVAILKFARGPYMSDDQSSLVH